jgi:Transmembrane amino acid transporter protein
MLVVVQTYITCIYVMESCARAELLADLVEGEESSVIVSPANKISPDKNLSPTTFGTITVYDDDILVVSQRTLDVEQESNVETLLNEDAGQEEPPSKIAAEEEEMNKCCPTSVLFLYYFDVKHRRTRAELGQGGKPVGDKIMNFSSLPVICSRKFELPELCRIFLGEGWRVVFTITTALDLCGITWSVAAVFASSLASQFSIREDEDDYFIFILIFSAIVIPLTCVPLIDQAWIQVSFFAGRMVMVSIMLITTAAAYNASVPHFGDQDGPERPATLANFRTLHL